MYSPYLSSHSSCPCGGVFDEERSLLSLTHSPILLFITYIRGTEYGMQSELSTSVLEAKSSIFIDQSCPVVADFVRWWHCY